MELLYGNNVIRLEARLPRNIGFASGRDLAVFTRLAITPPKINRFWMKFGARLVHCWGLALAYFGRDSRISDSLRGRRNFVVFFGPVNNARFHRLSVEQISRT